MEEFDETIFGNYGSVAFRTEENRSEWTCYDSSDYRYMGIVDDFGKLVSISSFENIRGY